MKKSPYGITIFCDDFRQESSGKYIIIGGYNGLMNINGPLPAILPTLAIVFNFNAPLGYKFEKIILEAVYEYENNEDTVLNIDLTEDFKNQNQDNTSTDDYERKITSVFFPAIVSPFEVRHEGRLSTRVYLDDTMFRVGTLNIKLV